MKNERLYDFIQNEQLGEVRLNEPLNQYTTWRIGGSAEIFCQPENWRACSRVLYQADLLEIPVTFLGYGSNVLVADEGVRGLVIQTKKMSRIIWEEPYVTAEAGVALAQLSQQVGHKGLRGLEFACGIPGSVGGAAIMNAGAYGSSMSYVVNKVRTLNLSGVSKSYSKEELEFAYRTSILKKNRKEIITEVEFILENGDAMESKRLMDEYLQLRKNKHPLHLPNAGSVFRNPPEISAGRLIEEAQAKGWRVGDAQVSEQHANFIVNLNRAKATDVIKLIKEVQKQVYNKQSIWLETEVVLMGFEDNRR
ncbi:MAG: UDP-N-acetylenolpyruvoylglucosamine reductase [Firmicutes bacterium HGW-Firmicutes-12]|jgi:UDP-N-acetylmuramate dehydrogenase|nr:MAG: UDP-N-acetylenolpyruvoylglucosamine reductase [Firmicutes bacterium HGW-Firmicutes-12]